MTDYAGIGLQRNPRYRLSGQASNAPSGSARNPRGWADVFFGGPYRIANVVTELGVPGRYRVRLHLRANGMLVRETFSAADGSYAFPGIAYLEGGYYAIAFDWLTPAPLNAAIADLLTPEPMP